MNRLKKTVFTLDINNSYPKEITDLTYPYMKAYAKKIGADFHIITERKFPDWYITYEKMQIYELGKQMGNDWNIYIDCDCLIHPDMWDITTKLNKDTVCHSAMDMGNVRWKYDEYFLRDGRSIGSCNWFTIASDWCLDLWKPIDDLTPSEAAGNIYPIFEESNRGITPKTLIDDYVLSRNIARYGLKFAMFKDFFKEYGMEYGAFLFHIYGLPSEEKAIKMKAHMNTWGTPILPND